MVIVWIRFVKSYHRRTAFFFDTEAKKPPAAFCVDRGAHLVYSDTRREGQPLSISTSNLLFFLSQTSDLLSFFQKYEDELIKETPAAAFTPCWISTGCVREIYLRAPAPATTFTVYSTMNALRGGIPWWPSASPLALRYRNARRCCASAATPWLDPRFHRRWRAYLQPSKEA